MVKILAIIQSVAAIALILIALGLGLSVLTWWFWTTSRPEPVSLAPLEIMSDRRFAKASEDERKKMIDAARGIVSGTEHSRRRRHLVQRPERDAQPEGNQNKPVDPLLK